MEQSRHERRRRRSRRRVVLGAAFAAVVTGGAIAAGALLRDDGSPHALRHPRGVTSRSAEPTTTAAPTTTAPHRDAKLGSGQAVTFAFGGDVHFEGGLHPKLLADPQGVLAPIAPLLSSADVAVVNLETAITERGAPQAKQYTFRAPAAALTALSAAGVDTATMANNHGEDFGPEGLADTLAAKQQTGFDVIGIGHNAAEAYTPHRMEAKGQRIAVFGATQVLDSNLVAAWTATDTQPGLASAKDPDVNRLLDAVKAARADSDTIVVFLHWGVEGQQCPSQDQQTLAQQLVDAGADIVVGSHSHRQEAGGRLGDAFVDYGLGNFVFYNESGPSGVSGVLTVTAIGRRVDSYAWAPAQLRGGVPTPLVPGPAADQAVAAWNDLRGCSGLTP